MIKASASALSTLSGKLNRGAESKPPFATECDISPASFPAVSVLFAIKISGATSRDCLSTTVSGLVVELVFIVGMGRKKQKIRAEERLDGFGSLQF